MASGATRQRFPLLGAYDLCLKCSHLFNILDARGAISVTERVGVIARVRALAVGIAKAWVDQQRGELPRKSRTVAEKKRRRTEVVPTMRSIVILSEGNFAAKFRSRRTS